MISACKAPSPPVNGFNTISTDLMTVTFGCNLNYTLLGVATTSCLAGGSGWDSATPVCGKK